MEFVDETVKKSSGAAAPDQNYSYVVLQVNIRENLIGTGTDSLAELESIINNQAAKGYRLHTISFSGGESKGFVSTERIQATLVFEKVG